MKRASIRSLSFLILLAPQLAYAQAYWPSTLGYLATAPEDGPSSIVTNIFDYFLIIASITSIVSIVYAGILYIVSQGNIADQKKARDVAIWSLVGLVVVFLAYAIVAASLTLPLFSSEGTLNDPGTPPA